jgi:hypothetical protein
LNPFQNPKPLIPKPLPYSIQPISPAPPAYFRPTPPAAQQPSPAQSSSRPQQLSPRSSPARSGPLAGQAKPPARFPTVARATEADSWVPPIIPSASPCPSRTRPSPAPPPLGVRSRHEWRRGSHAKGPSPGYLSRAPLLDLLPEPPAPPLPSPRAARTLACRRL